MVDCKRRNNAIWVEEEEEDSISTHFVEEEEEEIITKHIQTNNIIIFNCRQGIHRSSVAAVLSVLIAYHIGTLTYINDINDINNMKNTPPQTPEHKRFKSRPNMPLLTPHLSPTNILVINVPKK
eukprot:355980_1